MYSGDNNGSSENPAAATPSANAGIGAPEADRGPPKASSGPLEEGDGTLETSRGTPPADLVYRKHPRPPGRGQSSMAMPSRHLALPRVAVWIPVRDESFFRGQAALILWRQELVE